MVVSPDAESGRLTVYAATQSVHLTRAGIAACLGIEPEQVQVLAGGIGGCFGLKIRCAAGRSWAPPPLRALSPGWSSGSRSVARTWRLPGQAGEESFLSTSCCQRRWRHPARNDT